MKDILGNIGEVKIKAFLSKELAFDVTYMQPRSAYKIANHNYLCEGNFVDHNSVNKHGWVILYNDGSIATSRGLHIPDSNNCLDDSKLCRYSSRKLIKFMLGECATRREERILFAELVSNAKEKEKVNQGQLHKSSQLRQRKIVTIFNDIYNKERGGERKN